MTYEVENGIPNCQEAVLRLCCIFVATRLFPSNWSGMVSFLTSFCFVASLTAESQLYVFSSPRLIITNWTAVPSAWFLILLLLAHHWEPAESQSVNTDIVNAYVAAKVPMWGLLDLAFCMHWVQHLCATPVLCFMYMTVRHLVCTEALLRTITHLELLCIILKDLVTLKISTACYCSWPCQTFVMC